MTKLTDKEIADYTAKIEAMSQLDMCRLWRFGGGTGGDVYFRSDSPIWPIFKARFDKLGGFTPAISKQLGWGD